MNRDDIIQQLSVHKREWEHFGVKSLAVFGSVARSEDRPDSDVDILVEFDGPATFDRYMDLKFYLERLLGRKVDLVTPKALKPLLRPAVERDAVYVT